ncbi:MAG: HD domain-containing protein [Motiliproteus sp.]|nr:HD domain-containing protein [Motiliproteus sp.]MCW9053721.1 HD domain-containing protein [Motiliproteus sp.]
MTSLAYISPSSQIPEQLKSALPDDCLVNYRDNFEALSDQDAMVLLHVDFNQHTSQTAFEQLIQRCNDRSIPVLLTWEEDQDHSLFAIESGCNDYLSPPFHPSLVRSKIRTHLKLSSTLRDCSAQRDAIVHSEENHRQELSVVQDAAILCLAAMARVKDHSTGNHILRTQHYVKALAEHLRLHPRFMSALDDDDVIDLLYKTAALHDIGKVVIPDHILQKQGRLTDDEFEVMKKHPRFGYEAVKTAESLLSNQITEQAQRFLKLAQEVTLNHHEHWDGTGYPNGLEGENIPVAARLMAVADVYDAVVSRRPYKDACPHTMATQILMDGRGSHFDPAVIDAFEELEDTFARISALLESSYPSLSALQFNTELTAERS